MTDEAFLVAVESGHPGPFGHREHLRLAFVLIRELGFDEATVRGETILRHLAIAHGDAARFHVTMTTAWMRAVAHFMTHDPSTSEFSAFIDRNPHLLRRDLLDAHYSRERLFSPRARAAYVAPDRVPIPV